MPPRWFFPLVCALVGAVTAWQTCRWRDQRLDAGLAARLAAADSVAADARRVARDETAMRQALADAATTLRDSLDALKRRRTRGPAPIPPADSADCIPVPEVIARDAEWLAQLDLRDSAIAVGDSLRRVDSTAAASYERQLAAMTNVAVIHQTVRHDLEAALRKAPARAVGAVRYAVDVLPPQGGQPWEVRGAALVKVSGAVWARGELAARSGEPVAARLGVTLTGKVF